ncbi:pilus assembly protein TadG-related protein [Pseudarthrobacter sp902506025]|uniref:pilus assembly protein TadG-related protein n=1 Tax=Pseudarthrobacter sp. 902506025 TaxID=3155291 RepID=UPI00344C1512
MSLIVALLLVVLLGFAAMAVDVSMMFAEQAQLRNGADAAALAIAQTCAKYPTNSSCSNTGPLAANLANSNANDKLSNVKSIDLTTPNSVTVAVGAQQAGHTPNQVSLFFARALGISTAEVTAKSTAVWGRPGKGLKILPLALALCKLDISPLTGQGADQVLSLDKGCGRVPGGFGWIDNPGGTNCTVNVTAGQASDTGIWFSVNTGASAPQLCSANDFKQMNNQTVLFPLYDLAAGTGTSAKYYVTGFAAFFVTGYHFSNIQWPEAGGVANKSITGHFMKFVSLSQAFQMGPAADYQASIVRLTL